jgi:RimJ/RimL family protein N-acetyltransferase
VRLETERLVLRQWEDRDRPLYAEIVADPEVRRFFPSVGTRADADNGIDRAIARLAQHGFTFLAVERKADGAFIGMLGMAPFNDVLRDAIPSHPEVEIGWQFARRFWGQGYAPEGARAMLDFAWTVLRLPEVVAITTVTNLPSQRVMQKIGMVRDPTDDFLHPEVEAGHPLQPHVLYRIRKPNLG